jgi:ADP-ribose pyrophosphatase
MDQSTKREEYRVLATKILFDHPWVRIRQDTLKHHGIQQKYIYLESPVDAVATVGLNRDGQVALTRQYRHPVGKTIYDLPAGRMEPGESPIQAARREFEEETGYYPEYIQKLGYYNQFPGTLRAATNLFFARDLKKTHQRLDEAEILEIIFKPAWEVLSMILKGEIIDGSLQMGVLLAVQKGLIKI